MTYNPCYCWNLKDGCITIGIWSLVFSINQLCLFGWQSHVLQSCRQLLMIESLFNNCQDWCPCSRNPNIETTHTLIEGLFIVQIINIILSLFLLFASGSLIYGIYSNSKHLIWPWLPCMTMSIVGSAVYCILWWAGDVESYWLVLTIVEFMSIVINVYCLLCIIVQYKRVLNGYVQYEDEMKPRKIIHEYVPKQTRSVFRHANVNHDNLSRNLIGFNEMPPKYKQHEMLPIFSDLQRPYANGPDHRPVKMPLSTHAEDSPKFKERFTEAWINGVKPGGLIDQKQQATSPKDFNAKGASTKHMARSLDHLNNEVKSIGSVSCKSKSATSHRSRRHCRHHCSHRRARRSASASDSLSDDESTTHHARSCSTRRSTRSLGSCSTKGASSSYVNSDSDNATTSGQPRRRRRHRCQHKSTDEADTHYYHKQHRRPRDVKRDDHRRRFPDSQSDNLAYEQPSSDASLMYDKASRPTLNSRLQTQPNYQSKPVAGGVVSGYPQHHQLPAGSISIPQNIVIPAPNTMGSSTDPQKYHINSEITIHYDDEKQRMAEKSGRDQARSVAGSTESSANDSKRYTSTAV